METIDLVQPRHDYAPPFESGEQGHIYMPTSMQTVAARLEHVGVETRIFDENFRKARLTSNITGINLVGAPYIPEAIELQRRIRGERAGDGKFLLGGKVISGLKPDEFTQLFGTDSSNGNIDTMLTTNLRIQGVLPQKEDVSLIGIYEKIDDDDMREYLSREFGFYLSQGCNQACSFCAADKEQRERYRNIDIAIKDLNYLIQRAKKLGINKLSMYLSNLDLFQSPEMLYNFSQEIKRLKEENPRFEIETRGLSRVTSFLSAAKKHEEWVHAIRASGLTTVGFGVDGFDDLVFRLTRKNQTIDECERAVRTSRQDFGITPEILMVFGHYGADTVETLSAAYRFTVEMMEKYGAIPRPHISKSFTPGNEGWLNPDQHPKKAIDQLIQDPKMFQVLDFTTLASELTHPDQVIRDTVNGYYLKICKLSPLSTQWTSPQGIDETIEENKARNMGKYDR
ncbi:MAG: radical SAM protein [Candidatus Peregrinibacteria bacterium]|nr:radical SAM protein [Candidatus Peregrinibacteria bacterium]